MVEHLHQRGDVGIEDLPVDVAKGFSQGMAAIVPPEVDFLAPGLHEQIDVGNGQHATPFTALEQWFSVQGGRHSGEEALDRLVDGLVDGDCPDLPRFALAERIDMITRLQVPHLADRQPDQIRGPRIGIDAESEKSQVAGLVRKQLFDELDVLLRPDRFDGDNRAFFWAVRVLQRGSPQILFPDF